MYLPVEQCKTCTSAWLEATKVVNSAPDHEAYNVIIDIEEPLLHTEVDDRVEQHVDKFLRSHGALPLQSIANTIFPRDLYRRHGAPAFYDVYLEKVYPSIKRRQGDWGRYFERMIRHRTGDGGTINPLGNLVAKLHHHSHSEKRTFRNVYELLIHDPALEISIYDPERDAGPVMNRQCLSFLSFKLDRRKRLALTALYRNHYYVERLLGNLIGLSRLMEFIGREAGIQVGSLTVVSTHAEIDTRRGWRRGEVENLLAACEAAKTTTAVA